MQTEPHGILLSRATLQCWLSFSHFWFWMRLYFSWKGQFFFGSVLLERQKQITEVKYFFYPRLRRCMGTFISASLTGAGNVRNTGSVICSSPSEIYKKNSEALYREFISEIISIRQVCRRFIFVVLPLIGFHFVLCERVLNCWLPRVWWPFDKRAQ